jgi:hypothetical protein
MPAVPPDVPGELPKLLPPLPVIAGLPPVEPAIGEFTVVPGPPFDPFDPPSSDEHAPAHASALIAHHTRNCCPMIHLRTPTAAHHPTRN